MRRCEKCKQPIPAARLKAMPSTRLCVECKTGDDELPLDSGAPCVEKSIAVSSPDDAQEMAEEWRGFGRMV